MKLFLIAHGRVQGVFFRATVQDRAQALGLTGTVRNLANGTVEVVAFGPRERLEMLVVELEQTPPPAKVSHLDCTWEECEEAPKSFRIVC